MTDIIPNDLSHMSDEDFNALCPQGHHAPGPEPLSPAARTVLDAFGTYPLRADHISEDLIPALAAALEALADQVVPENYDPPRTAHYPEVEAFVDGKECRNADVRYHILAIAAELEGADD